MISSVTLLTSLIAQVGPKAMLNDAVATFMLLFFAMILLGLFAIWLLIAVIWIDNSTAFLKTKRSFARVAVWIGPILTAPMLVLSGHMAWTVWTNLGDDPVPLKGLLFLVLYCTLGPLFGVVASLFAVRFKQRMYR